MPLPAAPAALALPSGAGAAVTAAAQPPAPQLDTGDKALAVVARPRLQLLQPLPSAPPPAQAPQRMQPPPEALQQPADSPPVINMGRRPDGSPTALLSRADAAAALRRLAGGRIGGTSTASSFRDSLSVGGDANGAPPPPPQLPLLQAPLPLPAAPAVGSQTLEREGQAPQAQPAHTAAVATASERQPAGRRLVRTFVSLLDQRLAAHGVLAAQPKGQNGEDEWLASAEQQQQQQGDQDSPAAGPMSPPPAETIDDSSGAEDSVAAAAEPAVAVPEAADPPPAAAQLRPQQPQPHSQQAPQPLHECYQPQAAAPRGHPQTLDPPTTPTSEHPVAAAFREALAASQDAPAASPMRPWMLDAFSGTAFSLITQELSRTAFSSQHAQLLTARSDSCCPVLVIALIVTHNLITDSALPKQLNTLNCGQPCTGMPTNQAGHASTSCRNVVLLVHTEGY